MAEAEVGDDVFGDDPTVNSLQEYAADLLGKEAGLFVPTGSMGNQVCLGALARPGDEVVCDAGAHFLHYEGGSVAAHLGLMMRTLSGDHGIISAEQVGHVVRAGNMHNPRSSVVAIENTHNAAGGRIFPIEEARAVSKVAHDAGAAVHLDGARIFNAQAATGVAAAEWAACADTITFCFSKGLGGPIGSMVCSTQAVIDEARVLRKRLGGGMRQVGVIAAAARVALETGPARLHEDHDNALRLAQGLKDLHEDAIDVRTVETNMIYLNLEPFSVQAPEVSSALKREGVLTLGMPGYRMRLVAHRDVNSGDIDAALAAFRSVLASDTAGAS